MPIKPENRKLYSPRWKQISYNIRFRRAKGRCETCGAIHGQTSLLTPHHGPVVLACAHLDHDPTNNRATNLRCLCQRYHLNHDRTDNLRRARFTRMLKRLLRQPCLFPFDFGEGKNAD